MATYTVTTGNDTTAYTVSTGARGPAGPSGVGTTEEVLGLLQGTAADPTRIGAEYMPEVLEVSGVQLSDTSATELPSGTLGRSSGGRLVVHDGLTTGGVDVEGMILRGGIVHTVDDNIAADKFIEIARCVIPENMLTNGGAIFLVGKVIVRSDLINYNPSLNPAILFKLLDAAGNPNPSNVATSGYKITIATAATPASYTVANISEYAGTGVSTTLSFSPTAYSGSTKLTTYSVSPGAVDSNAFLTTSGLVAARAITYGGEGQFAYLSVGLYLPADAATADVTGSFRAAADLRIVKIA